jgi:uncharacterized protein YraI
MRPFNIALAALAIGGTVATSTPAAAQTQSATVITSLNARSGPGTGYAVVFVMPAGAQVGVYDCAGSGWCQILYGNRTGWASSRYLQFGGGAVSGDPDPVVVPVTGATARVTVQLNMRRGPGTSYGVVIAIPAGATVSVGQCVSSNTWCQASYGRYSGWVAARYLQYAANAGPRFRLSITFGASGQACFFEHWNYEGDSFCLRAGDDVAALNNWNDRISSIRVEAGAEVTVCRDFNYQGPCTTITANVPQLVTWNDTISAIRVRD